VAVTNELLCWDVAINPGSAQCDTNEIGLTGLIVGTMACFKHLIEQFCFCIFLKPVGVQQAVEYALVLECPLFLEGLIKGVSIFGLGDQLPISPKRKWVEYDPKWIGE